MHNIATVYRFNTPFLNLSDEKENLLWVLKKIEKSIAFDWIKYEKQINWLFPITNKTAKYSTPFL